MKIDCIVLAGGLGTRLRSAVADKPKCMAPIGSQPFLYYLLQYLHTQRVEHVILSLGYLSEQVISWCEQTPLPLRVSFSVEPEPLGTGGGIMRALPLVQSDRVYIVNGDTYFDINLLELFYFQEINRRPLSIALKPMQHFDRYGTVELDDNNKVTAFREKQYCESGLINGGVYVAHTDFLKKLDLPEKFSFEKDVLEPQVAAGKVYGYARDTYFIDIGIPEDYQKAIDHFTKS